VVLTCHSPQSVTDYKTNSQREKVTESRRSKHPRSKRDSSKMLFLVPILPGTP
jgi:hypothetical protein